MMKWSILQKSCVRLGLKSFMRSTPSLACLSNGLYSIAFDKTNQDQPNLTYTGKDKSKPITLHYITLHYITLHYITLHYITLHYITLHYIRLERLASDLGPLISVKKSVVNTTKYWKLLCNTYIGFEVFQ
jgi:hypothetical protein